MATLDSFAFAFAWFSSLPCLLALPYRTNARFFPLRWSFKRAATQRIETSLWAIARSFRELRIDNWGVSEVSCFWVLCSGFGSLLQLLNYSVILFLFFCLPFHRIFLFNIQSFANVWRNQRSWPKGIICNSVVMYYKEPATCATICSSIYISVRTGDWHKGRIKKACCHNQLISW